MRDGVRGKVGSLARAGGVTARRWTPPALLATLSAAAFAPALASGLGAAALASAAVATFASIGANVLTDVIRKGIARIPPGEVPSSLEPALEEWIGQELETGGPRADTLRAEIAEIFRDVGAVGEAVKTAVLSGDRDLQERLTIDLGMLGERFTEFGFVLEVVRAELRSLLSEVGNLADLHYDLLSDVRQLLELAKVVERGTGHGPVSIARLDGPPYRGLMPYGQDDAGVFYGRERATVALLAAVSQRQVGNGLLVVTGASGAGKSSLLRAGLMPAVAGGALSPEAAAWPRRVLEQTAGTPLERLAGLLAAMAGTAVDGVLDTLRERPERAHLLVRQSVEADARRRGLSDERAARCRLLLVVDHFEEVLTASGETASGDREAFVAALHAATVPREPGQAPAALVVVAVRGDFLDRFAAHPPLAAALHRGQFIVGTMAESDLHSAVTGPAQAAGLEIEPGLTELILRDLRSPGGEPGAGVLPLLSQAMLSTWQHREGTRLTRRSYALAGGIAEAVDTGAEEAYASLGEAERAAARLLFDRLTLASPQRGGEARRTVTIEALYGESPDGERAAMRRAVEVFAERRLLVVDDDSVRIGHDVLLTAWGRLRGWLEEQRAGRALLGELIAEAERWDDNDRAAGFLCRGERLATLMEAVPAWEADPDWLRLLLGLPEDYLLACLAAEARTSRMRWRMRAGLAVLLVVAVVTAVLAFSSQQDALHAEREADRRRDDAVSGELAARSQLLTNDPVGAALTAAAGWRVKESAETRHSLLVAWSNPARAVVPSGDVNSVAFHPDGTAFATGGADGTARLWDARTRHPIGTPMSGHAGPVDAVAYSPDGTLLATGSHDGRAMLWDTRTRRAVSDPLAAHTDRIESLAFSPDGRVLATAGDDRNVWLWDVRTRRALGRLPRHTEEVEAVVFSPDGSRIATGDAGGEVRLWHAGTRHLAGAPVAAHTGEIESLAFHPRGTVLVSAGRDGAARLWDTRTRRPLGARLHAHDSVVESVAFSPDGAKLATGGADNIVLLWDLRTREPVGAPLTGHHGDVEALAFSPDGAALVSGGTDGTTRVWDVRTRRPLGASLPGHAAGTDSVAFHPGGQLMATGGYDGTVRLWDVRTRRPVGGPLTGPTGRVDSLAFSPKGDLLATGGVDGVVRLWNVKTRRPVGKPMIGHSRSIDSLAFNPHGSLLATGGEDHAVRLWNVRTGAPIGGPLTGHTDQVESVAFDREGATLASGGSDGTVRLWNVATLTLVGAPINAHNDAVEAVAFHPGGALLATGGDDGTARLWEVATRRARGAPLSGHTGDVEALVFSPDGTTLATGSDDETVGLWDVETQRPLGARLVGHDGDIGALAFHPQGAILASGGTDGTVMLWDTAVPDDLYQAVCSIPGRSLTREEWRRLVAEVDYRQVC
ncbi:WD40 repeat domain-containing protein [Sinosporangium siamense]|uniref:Novel STAND NTPase 1 domain-containing protein n=1 Tax=Sinosporangium siamense TaxID=1367973 RepID=A0A919VAZ7_9ACTN|nr:WD40 repeat domain-containing protein [Sinosporangium siamense]GII95942.1 hypothetical protein Ssi02_61730 [Sinosporangium siamense]